MTLPTLSNFSILLDLIIPPRKTERIVRALTLDMLHELAGEAGTLPYHDETITALVWELKYRKNPQALSLAAAFLEEQIFAVAQESLGKVVLIPVPMHKTRRKERGFNPAEELCETIFTKNHDSFSYAPHALEKIRNTLPQQGLPKHRRVKNLIGAMQVVGAEAINDAVCIVIDDVQTTGATGEEATRALLEAGAREVHVLTLAHS